MGAMAAVKEKTGLQQMVGAPLAKLTSLKDVSFTHKNKFRHYKVNGLEKSSKGLAFELGQTHSLVILASGQVTFDGEVVDLSEARRLDEAQQRRLESQGRSLTAEEEGRYV